MLWAPGLGRGQPGLARTLPGFSLGGPRVHDQGCASLELKEFLPKTPGLLPEWVVDRQGLHQTEGASGEGLGALGRGVGQPQEGVVRAACGDKGGEGEARSSF